MDSKKILEEANAFFETDTSAGKHEAFRNACRLIIKGIIDDFLVAARTKHSASQHGQAAYFQNQHKVLRQIREQVAAMGRKLNKKHYPTMNQPFPEDYDRVRDLVCEALSFNKNHDAALKIVYSELMKPMFDYPVVLQKVRQMEYSKRMEEFAGAFFRMADTAPS
jgi:hypothetical protein